MAEERLFRELDGKYRILAQLGEGGTARVWLAVARGPSGFNKLVVLKTIRQELLNDEKIVEMFLGEARLAARLNHPNIVQTNEVFVQANHPVIVMEYLDGLPFSAVTERQRQGESLALAMLLRVVSEALGGLDAAHRLKDYDGTELSVVHRDVSPHNLFITFAGQVKILDFGIAQFHSNQEVTQTGDVKGKLRYMAPEQVAGERVDHRADLYSMGVILWELATGQRMWSPQLSDATILKKLLAHEIPKVREVDPSIDTTLAKLIEKALSLSPEDRHESAAAFQSQLDDYIGSLGGTIRNRDVGRALSKMFDNVRKERAGTIEQQLARTTPESADLVLSTTLPELTSFSNTRGTPIVDPHPRKFPTALLLVGFFLALLTFSLGLFWPQIRAYRAAASLASAPSTPPETQKAPLPSSQSSDESAESSSSQASPETEELIKIRLTAFPRGATLALDGAPLRSNPFSETVPRDSDTAHELKISAPGYLSINHTFTFEEDRELVFQLKKAPPSPPTPKSSQAKKNVAAPAPAPAPTALPEDPCSPPFYFDSRGVKKYKPECL